VLERRPDALVQNLSNCTNDGFMPLQSALKTGSVEIAERLLEILARYPDALAQNLSHSTNAGFMPLQHALASGSVENVVRLLEVLERHPEALAQNLSNCTNDGFMPLQQALASGSVENVVRLLEVLERHPEALAQNLSNCTNDGFRPLQHALASGSVEIAERLLEVLERRPDALVQNLSNCTNDGFMPLQSALKIGSVEIAERLLEILARYPDALVQNLSNRTNAGFMPLQQALASGSVEIVERLLEILARYPDALVQNLSNCTKAGFMPLQQALASGSVENVVRLLEILARYPDALAQNLSNRTHDGFMPLQSALKTGSVEIVERLLEILACYPDALAQNLSNRTHDGFMPLQQALISGSLAHIQSIIALSTKYLSQANWQRALLNVTKKGFSLLDSAIMRNEPEIVAAYLRALYQALGHDAVKALPRLLRKKYDFDKDDKNERAIEKLIDEACAGRFPVDTPQLYSHRAPSDELEEGEIIEDSLLENRSAVIPLHPLPSSSSHIFSPKRMGDENQGSSSKRHKPFLVTPAITTTATTELSLAIVTPFAGINSKYLVEQPIKEDVIFSSDTSAPKNQQHTLIPLSSLFDADAQAPYQSTILQNNYIQAKFYSQRGAVTQADKITFVCAGRKEKALLPQPKEGRCVIVCTKAEFNDLRQKGLHHVDALVVDRLTTRFGDYTELGRITSRRLAILLAAHHWGLHTCIMVDDNVHGVAFNPNDNSSLKGWDSFYQLLESQLRREPCVSVSRQFAPSSQPGQLGSKLFMLDMQKIRTRLPNLKDISLLLPPPHLANYWGEDYFLQLMLHHVFRPDAQGYRVIDKSDATLTRSNKHRDAFALSSHSGVRILAQPFPAIPPKIRQHMEPAHAQWLQGTITLLNQIIQDNQESYAAKIAQTLPGISSSTTTSSAMPSSSSSSAMPPVYQQRETALAPRDFVKKFKEHLVYGADFGNTLRNYQRTAIRKLGETKITAPLNIIMATGTGKTRVQCKLAEQGYPFLAPWEHIVIVTANIALVEQFYQDFVKQNGVLPKDHIHSISSQHIDIEQGLVCGQFAERPKVLIFCIDSFTHLLERNPHFLSQIKILLLDEYQDYYSNVVKLIGQSNRLTDTLILGLTATPPSKDVLQNIYTYSRSKAVDDNVLAPLVVDSLGADYHPDSVKALIEMLPTLLTTQYHPGFTEEVTTLASIKGIVYLPSIKECNLAKEALTAAGFTSYAIHSENKEAAAELELYKKSKSGVLVACQTCKMGFDDPTTSYVVIGQNPSPAMAEQMIGRVMRRHGDKIGYVLAFNDVARRTLYPLLKQQKMTLPLSLDYLAQDRQEYKSLAIEPRYFNAGEFQMKEVEPLTPINPVQNVFQLADYIPELESLGLLHANDDEPQLTIKQKSHLIGEQPKALLTIFKEMCINSNDTPPKQQSVSASTSGGPLPEAVLNNLHFPRKKKGMNG
jgi:superfamily II DNA or RNA helicase/ankyrin repeat protein